MPRENLPRSVDRRAFHDNVLDIRVALVPNTFYRRLDRRRTIAAGRYDGNGRNGIKQWGQPPLSAVTFAAWAHQAKMMRV